MAKTKAFFGLLSLSSALIMLGYSLWNVRNHQPTLSALRKTTKQPVFKTEAFRANGGGEGRLTHTTLRLLRKDPTGFETERDLTAGEEGTAQRSYPRLFHTVTSADSNPTGCGDWWQTNESGSGRPVQHLFFLKVSQFVKGMQCSSCFSLRSVSLLKVCSAVAVFL